MKKRMIEVWKCSPVDCPYCTPDAWNKNLRYCDKPQLFGALNRQMRPVKTFPRFCPLNDLQEGE